MFTGLKIKSFAFWLALVWLLLTTILLVIPGNALPKTKIDLVPHADKWIHVLLFFILVVLWVKAWMPYDRLSVGKKAMKIALFALLYGIGMEFVQKYWVANRSFDLMDILADGAGALAGAGFIWWLRRR